MTKATTESVNGLRRVRFHLKGQPPGLLMGGKGIMEADAEKATSTRGEKRTREEEAELLAHWVPLDKKRVLCVPFVNLYGSFCQAAKRFKAVNKIPMSDLLASAISCPVDRIPLLDEKGKPTDVYEVYAEWVRIPPRTGAMVKIGRPRIRTWQMVVEIDLADMSPKVVKEIIVMAGRTVGIGPWRPQLKGPYGKFTVEEFEEAK